MKRRTAAIILALAMLFAMALSGCGGKSAGDAAAAEGAEGAGAAKNEDKETVVTADTKEDARKLAEAFYAGLKKADSVSMTFYSEGEVLSEFKKSGDTVYSGTPSLDFAYYGFVADGSKYFISDGETAYEDEYMYNMIAESLETTLDMLVLGYFGADDDGALQFSATQTDKTAGGVSTSKLVTVVTGEEDGRSATITVTGTAENGAVSNILCEMDMGEDSGKYELRFAYDNVSVELPAYTIGESRGEVSVEGTHVESPYRTLGELMATLGEDESLFYIIEDGCVYAVGEKDGRNYQVSAPISAEDEKALDGLDFFSDTYDSDRDAILAKLAVDDCVDFTDVLVPQSELDAFVGKTAQDILDAGYEVTGWGTGWESASMTFAKDYMEYEATLAFTDGFDPDAEHDEADLYGFTVKQLRFSAPEYIALPIR